MKITTFDRSEHRRLSAAIEAALKKVGDDFGVDLTAAGGVFGENRPHIKIAVTVRDNGSGMSSEHANFNRYCAMYGLKPEHFGQNIILDRTAYEIVGIKTSSGKYPIQIKRIFDGKVFGCSALSVTRQFATKVAA